MLDKIITTLTWFGCLLAIVGIVALGVVLIAVFLSWMNSPLTDDDDENDDEPNNDPHAFI